MQTVHCLALPRTEGVGGRHVEVASKRVMSLFVVMASLQAPRSTRFRLQSSAPRRICLRRPLRAVAYKTKRGSLQVSIRPASSQDFWAAAEVHASAFHFHKGLVAYNFAKISRFNDIVRSHHLRHGTDVFLGWEKRYICLVAEGTEVVDEELLVAPVDSPVIMTTFLRNVYPPGVRDSFKSSALERRIYGAMNLDTAGRFIPLLSMDRNRRRRRPQGCAYFSNLSVLPCVRRRSVGTSLICEAERLAKTLGCWGASLHCSQENTAAFSLYTKQGYVAVPDAPVDKNDCVFLAKVF